MALVPMGYILPRRPPVPKGITVQKTVVEFLPLAGGDVLDDFGGVVGVARLGEPRADVADRPGREFARLCGGLQFRQCLLLFHVWLLQLGW